MARFVDPVDLLRTGYERAQGSLRLQLRGHMTAGQRFWHRLKMLRLYLGYRNRSWIMRWNRDDLAVMSFTNETSAGRVEILLSSRGDLEMFLFDRHRKPVRFGTSLVGNESHLVEALGWIGVDEREAKPLARKIWATVKPVPRRGASVRHLLESGIEPQPVHVPWSL